MFRVFLTNFGYFLEAKHDTIEGALRAALEVHFECTIIGPGGKIVATWGPFSGTRVYATDLG
jgi:hypothetical protein